jgi:hypothetical protein
VALSWRNLPCALRLLLLSVSGHWATRASLARHRSRSKALGLIASGADRRSRTGGVADSLKDAKAAFRRGGGVTARRCGTAT